MGSSTDDFEALQALLKLKRYEMPPPRFFDELPRGVLGRLRGPDGLREESLLSSLGLGFLLRPAMFYGLGAVGCGVALVAVVSMLANRPDPAAAGSAGTALLSTPPGLITPAVGGQESVAGSLASDPAASSQSQSTNPVLSPVDSSFAIDPFRIKPTPASYRP